MAISTCPKVPQQAGSPFLRLGGLCVTRCYPLPSRFGGDKGLPCRYRRNSNEWGCLSSPRSANQPHLQHGESQTRSSFVGICLKLALGKLESFFRNDLVQREGATAEDLTSRTVTTSGNIISSISPDRAESRQALTRGRELAAPFQVKQSILPPRSGIYH